ncbi:MAG: hypothetical protein H0U21_06780 [Acidimicrobiia bacterium]|nr:hypothetical protein [Acidimicrobiia bacterium]
MLRASRRLLRPGGRTAFFTIHPAPGLSSRRRRRAHRDGPVAVASHLSQRDLLERGGFVDIAETDRTVEFATVARAWIEQRDRHQDQLVEALGEAEFEQRQREARVQLRAIDDGLLRRSLLVAVCPND